MHQGEEEFEGEMKRRPSPYVLKNPNAGRVLYKIATCLTKTAPEIVDALFHLNGLASSESPFAKLLTYNVPGNLFELVPVKEKKGLYYSMSDAV